MAQVHISRAGRKAQILEILCGRWIGHTTHGLAKKVGLTNSKHFRDMVCEMYQEGLIGGVRVPKPNGKDAYLWWCLDRDERFPNQGE